MVSVDDSADVFLVPAGSPEDQEILEATIQGGGLTRSDLEPRRADSPSEEAEAELESYLRRREGLQQRLSERRSRQRDLQSKIENTAGYDTSERPQQESRAAGQESRSWVEQEAELEDEIADLEAELEEIEAEIVALRQARADQGDRPDPRTGGQALEDFESLAAAAPDSAGVYCWPVEQSTREQHQFSPGDLFLFYRGNRVYRFAATVGGEATSEALWGAIAPGQSEEALRPHFVVFEDVVRVQVDSAVIADIADHELDYPVGFLRLDEAANEELRRGFGGLEAFVEQAQKEGVNTRPRQPETDKLEAWLGDSSTSSGPTSAESSLEPDTEASSRSADSTPAPEATAEGEPDGETDADSGESAPAADPTVRPHRSPDLEVSDLDGRSEWRVLRDLLRSHKLVELVGPEKTGKRRLVEELVANWFTDAGRLDAETRVRQTNFHPDAGFEEFVLGGSREDGTADMLAGPVGDFIDLAAADTQQFVPKDDREEPKYLLVVENLRAADPATVFGELWQAMRPANRGRDAAVSISGTGSELWVPERFYVLGVVDSNREGAARRDATGAPLFRTHQTAPDTGALREAYGVDGDDAAADGGDGSGGEPREFGVESVFALERLNDRIRESDALGPRYALGQYHLSRRRDRVEPLDEVGLCEAWQYSVFPTLGGYHDDGLTGIGETLLADVVPDADKPLALGRIQSDVDLVRGIVTTLARRPPAADG